MGSSWNILGIIAWVILILFLFFVIQNSRQRHLKMIIVEGKRFTVKNFIVDFLEIVFLIAGVTFMTMNTFFAKTNLSDDSLIKTNIQYQPLVLEVGEKNAKPYYVLTHANNSNSPRQTFIYYTDGQKATVTNTYATISADVNPLPIKLANFLFTKKELQEKDARYQKAYVAVLKSTFKNNWRNGLALHAGARADNYYLIRVPDPTFIHNEYEDDKN